VAWHAYLQVAVGVVLLVAAVAKVTPGGSVRPFLAAIGVPGGLAAPLARALPAVEAASGLLLLLGRPSWAAVPAAVLTAGFTAVLGWAALAGVTESCRCFGAVDTARVPRAVGLARAVLLAVAAVGLLLAGTPTSDVPAAALLVGALTATVYIATFAMAGQVLMFERARADRRRPRPAPARTTERSTA
jgi:hypothetical protein